MESSGHSHFVGGIPQNLPSQGHGEGLAATFDEVVCDHICALNCRACLRKGEFEFDADGALATLRDEGLIVMPASAPSSSGHAGEPPAPIKEADENRCSARSPRGNQCLFIAGHAGAHDSGRPGEKLWLPPVSGDGGEGERVMLARFIGSVPSVLFPGDDRHGHWFVVEGDDRLYFPDRPGYEVHTTTVPAPLSSSDGDAPLPHDGEVAIPTGAVATCDACQLWKGERDERGRALCSCKAAIQRDQLRVTEAFESLKAAWVTGDEPPAPINQEAGAVRAVVGPLDAPSERADRLESPWVSDGVGGAHCSWCQTPMPDDTDPPSVIGEGETREAEADR